MISEPRRPGLRERQRQETHRLIRRTAIELTLEQGAASVSVKNICEAAGVSARTFFNHFRSKDEALLPDFPDFSVAAQEAFVLGTEPDLVSALEQLLLGYVAGLHAEEGDPVGPMAVKRLLEANPELLPRLLTVFEVWQRLIAELVARRTGRGSNDLFCLVAALAATSTLRAAYMVIMDRTGAESTDSVGPTLLNEQVKTSIQEAFSVFRQLTVPDSTQPSPSPT
jgi:AcrR family transcriptional regulator